MFTLSILFINILIKDFKILTDNKQRKDKKTDPYIKKY